jgi:sterol desaturase/sphingolipid hydroxylase (fatty acid hydroxylase superfamily)
LIFSYITGHWWIFVFYYCWAAFIQEIIEHDPEINWYPFTSGRWHLLHHRNFEKNYGLFHPVWDRIFQTEML